jgi:hypothetical protein
LTRESGAAAGFGRLLPLDGVAASSVALSSVALSSVAGAKAARLAAAMRAGMPVLPGCVVPCDEARSALSAGVAAVRGGDPAAARRAVLSHPLDPALGAELTAAVPRLGGRVIVRSSSPLETDPLWSGAFSSIAEVGPDDVATAVRSCWAAAFAADPLARLESCGLPPEALDLGLVIQPELRPAAGGTARVSLRSGGEAEVDVAAVAGHPGAMLAGWAEGVSARLLVPAALAAQPAAPARAQSLLAADSGLAGLIGSRQAGLVAWLAARVRRRLGDDVIEWAIQDGQVFLLQSLASAGTADGCDTGTATADPDVTLCVRRWRSPGITTSMPHRCCPSAMPGT